MSIVLHSFCTHRQPREYCTHRQPRECCTHSALIPHECCTHSALIPRECCTHSALIANPVGSALTVVCPHFNTMIFSSQPWCRALHAITQYLLSCNFFWMFCEGFYLHTIIVVAFIKGRKLLVGCCIIGWCELPGGAARGRSQGAAGPGGGRSRGGQIRGWVQGARRSRVGSRGRQIQDWVQGAQVQGWVQGAADSGLGPGGGRSRVGSRGRRSRVGSMGRRSRVGSRVGSRRGPTRCGWAGKALFNLAKC